MLTRSIIILLLGLVAQCGARLLASTRTSPPTTTKYDLLHTRQLAQSSGDGPPLLTMNGTTTPEFIADVDGPLVSMNETTTPRYRADVISAGDEHVCVVLEGGVGACWGANQYGQLGDGSTATKATPSLIASSTQNWELIASGCFHTCGIKRDLSLWCWGKNSEGQLGIGKVSKQNSQQPTPLLVDQRKWSYVSAGESQTCALDYPEGKAYCFGDNEFGQLGTGDTSSRTRPTEVVGDLRFKTISAGKRATCGIEKGTEKLYCWGDITGFYGSTSTQAEEDTPIASQVAPALPSKQYANQILTTPTKMSDDVWTDVDTGDYHPCAIAANGSAFCWEYEREEMQPDGKYLVYTVPLPFPRNDTYRMLSVEATEICLVNTGNEAFCYDPISDNLAGCLGDGTTYKRTYPVQVVGNATWQTLSVGQRFSCGIKLNGTVFCWGRNDLGQMGQGYISSNANPTPLEVKKLEVNGIGVAPAMSPPAPSPTDGSSSSLSTGAIVGIVIGSVVGAALLLGGGWYALKRRKKNKQLQDSNLDGKKGVSWAATAPTPTGNNFDSGSSSDKSNAEKNAGVGSTGTPNGDKKAYSPFMLSMHSSPVLSADPLLTSISADLMRTPTSSNASRANSERSQKQSSATRLGKKSSSDAYKNIDFESIRIKQAIGEGGFGRVYLGTWNHTAVAVKVLVDLKALTSPDFAERNEALNNARLIEDMEKEAGIMSSLRHPNILSIMGVCTNPPAIITEWCARGSLTHVLEQALASPAAAAKLTWRRRLQMALDTAKGMVYLHSNTPGAILHRDLKSPNLLVDAHFTVKVADFNLSKLLEDYTGDGSGGLRTETVGATNPKWLAPCVVSGAPHTTASDVFAFGTVMWELLTWQVPWSGYGNWAIVGALQAGERLPIPPLNELPGEKIPEDQFNDFVAILKRCWEQDPTKRPPFTEIAQDLGKIIEKYNKSAAGIAAAS